MAKKPPQPPKPPHDDFDPERELNDEIAPLDDEIVEVVGDDVFDEVVADDGTGTTQLGHAGDAEVLPEVEVDADEVIIDADDDAFANVVVEDGDETTKLGHDDVDAVLPEVEVDDALAEVEADEALADADAVVEDDLLDGGDKGVVVEDEEFSPHEAETMGSVAALDPDDPFAGVGDTEGELVTADVGGGGDVVAEEPYYEEEAPTPKTHWFTWTLIGLNIVAALVAPYMIVLDFHKRQQYTHAVFMLDLAALGVPTENEEIGLTAARVTLPGYRILPEQMKKIFDERRVGTVSDKFEGFDGSLFRRIAPSTLDSAILSEHFKASETYAGGPPVATVEAEIKRLLPQIVPDIKEAAKNSLENQKSDAAKRTGIIKMLQPLAMDTYQADKLEKAIKSAQGPELDALYLEAAQRRMAFDFLLPLELFRPGETKGMVVESFGDLEKLPLDKVLQRVEDRVKSTIDKNYQPAIHFGEEWGNIERDTIEKRLTISFTLLSLAHVKKPDGEVLFPNLLERIPVVMGQYDFALACELFPRGLMNINQLVLDRIQIEREGFVTDKAGTQLRGKAFIDYYEDELQRIRFIQNDIFKAKIRLADLQATQKADAKLLEERKEQRDDVLKRIAAARTKTEKAMTELRSYQSELFRYELGLANSEETLTEIHNAIREKMGKKESK